MAKTMALGRRTEDIALGMNLTVVLDYYNIYNIKNYSLLGFLPLYLIITTSLMAFPDMTFCLYFH